MGALAALAATALPAVAAPRVPVLYGDGEHDDTEALQAALDGRPVRRLDGNTIQFNVGTMPAGIYLLNAPLAIVHDNFVISDSTFIQGPKMRSGEAMFRIKASAGEITNNRFVPRPMTRFERLTERASRGA